MMSRDSAEKNERVFFERINKKIFFQVAKLVEFLKIRINYEAQTERDNTIYFTTGNFL